MKSPPLVLTREKESKRKLFKKFIYSLSLLEEASIEENQRETANLRQRAESAEKLSAKLENDLASALGGGALRETDQMSTLDMLRTSTGADESSKTRNQEENIRAEASLVPILTSQRNRLHEKVTQLEELLAIEKTKQMTVSTEAEKVRDDNKKLYEKVRFLQGGANKSSAVEIEQDIFDGNNFRKFANSDRNRSLQLHDRATLTVGRAILSSSKSRMIFLVYLLILHLLIMLVLYKFAYDQATLRDQETECDYKFMQHMKSHTDH